MGSCWVVVEVVDALDEGVVEAVAGVDDDVLEVELDEADGVLVVDCSLSPQPAPTSATVARTTGPSNRVLKSLRSSLPVAGRSAGSR